MKRRSTTERGLGGPHQTAKKHALMAMRDGQPCCLCGRPIYKTQKLDYDHTVDRQSYRGLAHAHCNRSDGARRGNRARGTNPIQALRASRRY